YTGGDLAKLKTLNLLARELIEDRPTEELFGFIVDRVLEHTQASRAALGLLGADGKSFVNVEVRRQDRTDTSELRISHTVLLEVVEELKTASMIQRGLLPAAPSGIDGYTFAGANRPCRTVSGDYYDFVRRPDGRMYFVIADVSGKGITAGLMMAGLQASFRIFCKGDPSPAALVSQLNDALKDTLPQSKFVTLFLGRLDLATGLIE